MGIEGLLRSLKDVTVKKHIREYRGKTVGIDTYVWLHKIVKGQCVNELYEGRLSDRFVKECLSRIQVIQSMGVNVLMVFDGGKLPSKAGEEQTREQKREECRNRAKEYLAMGQLDLAKKKTAEAFDISPDIAYRLIAALKDKRLPFVVAPYQADAQLAYLSRQGLVDVVITEDSDLLAFGARSVLYKFDYRDYTGEEILLERLCENKVPYLKDFTHCMFLTACIFSGCDYLNQVRGVGPTGAFNLISRNRNAKAALRELRSAAKLVPADYQENFIKAFLTFRFQRVYCPRQKRCVMLNDIKIAEHVEEELAKIRESEPSFDGIKITDWADEILDQYLLEELEKNPRSMDFVGIDYSPDTIIKIAEGNLNPCTLHPYLPITVPRPIQNEYRSNQPEHYAKKSNKSRGKDSGQLKLTDLMALGSKLSSSQTSSNPDGEEKKTGYSSTKHFMPESSSIIEVSSKPVQPTQQEVPKPKLLIEEPKKQVFPPMSKNSMTFEEILESGLLDPMFPPNFVSDLFNS